MVSLNRTISEFRTQNSELESALPRQLANHVGQNLTAFFGLLFGQIHRGQEANYRAVRAIHQQSAIKAFLDNGRAIDSQFDADHYASDTHFADNVTFLGQSSE